MTASRSSGIRRGPFIDARLREDFTYLSNVKSSPISTYDTRVQTRPSREQIPLAHQLARAAYELHAALERHLHDTLIEHDLTLPLSDVLWQLDPALGPLSRRELAERLCCDPSNVTFLVDRLEQRRLVSRARAGSDRRVKVLALTPAGIHVRDRLIATIAASAMFSGLTSARQRQLADLLECCVGSGHSSR
jgi:MarR family transcriptional regulator, organic hydroperoxide resistance regulator